MKHYIIEVTYTAPLEKIDAILAEHRAFLQRGYDSGWLLVSGPQNPRTGGMIVARAPSLAELQSFFAQDPFQVAGIATYRFIEFAPVKRQSLLDAWCQG